MQTGIVIERSEMIANRIERAGLLLSEDRDRLGWSMNEKAEYYTQLLVNTDKGVKSNGTGTYFIKTACWCAV